MPTDGCIHSASLPDPRTLQRTGAESAVRKVLSKSSSPSGLIREKLITIMRAVVKHLESAAGENPGTDLLSCQERSPPSMALHFENHRRTVHRSFHRPVQPGRQGRSRGGALGSWGEGSSYSFRSLILETETNGSLLRSALRRKRENLIKSSSPADRPGGQPTAPSCRRGAGWGCRPSQRSSRLPSLRRPRRV